MNQPYAYCHSDRKPGKCRIPALHSRVSQAGFFRRLTTVRSQTARGLTRLRSDCRRVPAANAVLTDRLPAVPRRTAAAVLVEAVTDGKVQAFAPVRDGAAQLALPWVRRSA